MFGQDTRSLEAIADVMMVKEERKVWGLRFRVWGLGVM